jgi:hypothetical protein
VIVPDDDLAHGFSLVLHDGKRKTERATQERETRERERVEMRETRGGVGTEVR